MKRTASFMDISFSELPQPMQSGVSLWTVWNQLPAFTGGSGLVSHGE
jgi:hypothetical protein